MQRKDLRARLAKESLKEAELNLKDSKLLFENKRYSTAFFHALHSMELSTAAILYSHKNVEKVPRSHGEKIRLLGKYFITEGKIPEKFGRKLNKYISERERSMYVDIISGEISSPEKRIKKGFAKEAMEDAEELLKLVNSLSK